MAISIRNRDCENLARNLADRNGSGMTEEILGYDEHGAFPRGD
jgi:hypothetical protein